MPAFLERLALVFRKTWNVAHSSPIVSSLGFRLRRQRLSADNGADKFSDGKTNPSGLGSLNSAAGLLSMSPSDMASLKMAFRNHRKWATTLEDRSSAFRSRKSCNLSRPIAWSKSFPNSRIRWDLTICSEVPAVDSFQ